MDMGKLTCPYDAKELLLVNVLLKVQIATPPAAVGNGQWRDGAAHWKDGGGVNPSSAVPYREKALVSRQYFCMLTSTEARP